MKKSKYTRRDFIKTTSAVSLGCIASLPDIYSENQIVKETRFGTLDPKIFLDPGNDYRGVPFFFFNDDIDDKEAVRQLKEIHKAGWGKVLPRRYSGLMNPVYGKTWNNTFHEIIKTCKELNMKVFIQEVDKNAWYSAPPTPIPGMKDKYRNKFIIRRNENEDPAENEILLLHNEGYKYFQHTSYPQKGFENSFCYLDLLDKDTVDSYLSALFSFLGQEFGNELGKTIEAIWIAEPHITIGNPSTHDTRPWTPKLNKIFLYEWGYPLIENIPKLFEDTDNFQKVRYHYWRTLSRLLVESYTRTMQNWSNKYNIKLTGHLMGEDTFVSQLQYSVNIMPHFEYMDIPGIDHLTMDPYWPTGDPFIFTPKLASSVANQMGKKEVLAEMYGCSDMGNSFEDRKTVFQWLGIMGVNYRNYHGAFYSMRGMRKRKFPVNLNYQQPYWSKNKVIADFAARLSYLLKQGNYKADILVINSIESYYTDGRISRKLSKVVDPIQRNLVDLSHNLLKIHRGFDYGDETIISKYGAIRDNAVVIGEMSYKVVVLPSVKTLRKSTLKLLTGFLDAGGSIISTGDLPETIDAEPYTEIDSFNKRLRKVENKPDTLQSELSKLAPADILINSNNNLSAEKIWVHERILDDGTLFFLTNTSAEDTVDTEIRIKGSGKLEHWNLESGRIESIPQTAKGNYRSTTYRFVPGGSYTIFLNSTSPQGTVVPAKERTVAEIQVNDFKVRREDPNSLTLDFCRYHKGDTNWSELLPVQGVQDILSEEKYSGPVSLRFDFMTETVPTHCSVVIEEADKYLVTVNNTEIRYNNLPYYRDKDFLPIDITHFIRPGSNFVQLSRNFEAADETDIYSDSLRRFYGTELEQIYLIGDFGVRGKKVGEDYFECKRDRYKPAFVLMKETGITNGDLLADGYCFFNGSIVLTSEVDIPEISHNHEYHLNLEELETVTAGIKINDRSVGYISWKPYRIEITDYVSQGMNKVEIILTNSLRNLLGELHYIPVTDTKAGQWSEKSDPSLGDGSQWYKNRNNNKRWTDDYFFRSFGVGNVKVLIDKIT